MTGAEALELIRGEARYGIVPQAPNPPPATPGFDWSGLTCEHIPLRWPPRGGRAKPPAATLFRSSELKRGSSFRRHGAFPHAGGGSRREGASRWLGRATNQGAGSVSSRTPLPQHEPDPKPETGKARRA